MKYPLVSVFGLLVISACSTHDIEPVDTSDYESQCVSDCAQSYSMCTADDANVDLRDETLRACQEDYSACVQACPRRTNNL